MAGCSQSGVVRDIQILYDSGTAGGLSDRLLLEQFLSRRDAMAERAFEVLLLRHGPMVLRVCRNILREPSDIDDAFQATFLVLVKRSRSMVRIESVGGWLYGVAYRVAARARAQESRRRASEQRAALRVVEAVDSHDGDGPESADLGPIVQDEVRQLPAAYRDVLVLCYWEGLTHEQAAAQLGCPLGTVRSRIARARKRLERRLNRRGLESLDVGPAALIRPMPGLSAVPAELVQATVRAATHVAGGGATAQVLSNLATTLVQDVLGSMTMIKIKMALVGVALVGFTGSGVWLSGLRGQSTRAPIAADRKEAAQAEKTPRTDSLKVHAALEYETSIIMIVPDGTSVKRGQVVCELDSAALRDQLIDQQITTRAAEATYQNSKVGRETAEIDVAEYEQGIYPMLDSENAGEIEIAEAELDVADESLTALRRTLPQSVLEIKRAELTVLKARIALEKARNRRRILADYTKPKTLKGLRTAVAKLRSDELAKQANFELQVSKERKLERQIGASKIVAPADGTLVYARPTAIGPYMAVIGLGATVHHRQLLFEIAPATSDGR